MREKPSLTDRPYKPVTPKKKVSGFIIELGLSKHSSKKLRAIAKHAEALANELDTIDNGFTCPECESTSVCEFFCDSEPYRTMCNNCGRNIKDDELPKGLEGSE